MSEKKYELLTDYTGDLKGGQEARKYPDGSIRNERGFMLEPLPGAAPIDSSERGRELVERRHALAREKALEGVRLGAGLDAKGRDAEEISIITEHATRVFLGSKNARGLAELFSKVMQSAGLDLEPKATAEKGVTQTPSLLVALGPEALDRLLSKVKGEKPRDVIDIPPDE